MYADGWIPGQARDDVAVWENVVVWDGVVVWENVAEIASATLD